MRKTAASGRHHGVWIKIKTYDQRPWNLTTQFSEIRHGDARGSDTGLQPSGEGRAKPGGQRWSPAHAEARQEQPDVTLISLGGMMAALSPDYLDIAWSMGIRYFDTADCYLKGNSEKIIGEWIAKYPERRKELFLVSKDHPRQGPDQLLEQIDKRLAACGTDYLDLFFVHGLGTE